MMLTLRPETKSDERIVEEMTLRAFWNFGSPVCTEPYLCHVMY